MIFRLLFDDKLGARLNEEALRSHAEKLRTISDYAHRARRYWESRPAHVSVARYAAFKLLHQEFAGSGVPGLPLLLGTGRRLARATSAVAPFLTLGRFNLGRLNLPGAKRGRA